MEGSALLAYLSEESEIYASVEESFLFGSSAFMLKLSKRFEQPPNAIITIKRTNDTTSGVKARSMSLIVLAL